MAKSAWSALLSRSHGRRTRNRPACPRRQGLPPALERLEDRTLPSLSGIVFGGLNYDPGQGVTPPDTIMSAGPNHVVEAVNDNLLFINKSTIPNNISGTVQSFTDFFPGTTHSTFGLLDVISDPSVNFDRASGKWVVSILDIDTQNDKGYLNVAVSDTSDPTGSWNKFQLDLTDGHGPLIPGNAGLTLWGDFERFGSSATAYVWTVNMFSFSSGGIDQNSQYDHVQVIAVDKSNLANVHTIDVPGWDAAGGTITNENLLPVRMDGAAAADGTWFAEETNYGSPGGQANSVKLVHVANVLTATAADFVNFTGTVPLYHFIPVADPSGQNHAWNNGDANSSAVQKGSADLIETNDTRMDSAVWRVVNGQQHLLLTQTVNSDADPGVAKARWYDFNTTGATDPAVPVPLYQSGEINPGAGVYTYFPSADIDPAGDLGMTYLESSPTEYMSMYVAGKTPAESAVEAGVLAAAGNSSLTGPDASPHRAGDYSGTVVDTNADGTAANAFWSANEYANGGVWGTAMSSYTISTPPPPPGASVTASTPSGTVAGPVSSIVFTFSQAMDTTSFAPASDVDSFTFTPTSGSAVDLTGQITGYVWIDNQHLQVNFTAQNSAGAYQMVIGPQILTAAGTALDQNQNGTPGETSADEYAASFAIPAPSQSQTIEDFESPHVYHVVFPPLTFTTSTGAAHDGTYGLVNHGGSDWIYRDDAAAQVHEGETISAWLQFAGTADGQANFAFGAFTNADGSPGATYSFVLSADKRKLSIQENFFGSGRNTTIGTSAGNTRFQANHWYRIEITWGTNGSIVGKLFDSDGTTLINSVSATANLFTAGGIGFHATGHDKYWDTVTAVATGSSGPQVHTGRGGHGGASELSASLLVSDLATPSTPGTFVRLSEGGVTGPAWISGTDRDMLLFLLDRTQQLGGGSQRGGKGRFAVTLDVLQSLAGVPADYPSDA